MVDKTCFDAILICILNKKVGVFMSLQIRILGMQKEPTGLEKGREIHDFQYRTRDAEAFE